MGAGGRLIPFQAQERMVKSTSLDSVLDSDCIMNCKDFFDP